MWNLLANVWCWDQLYQDVFALGCRDKLDRLGCGMDVHVW